MNPLRVGLVGPGRTRNGLGPFQAAFLEQAGGLVVAASGRSPERAERACADLAERLGHSVEVESSVDTLVARGDLDALIVACPAAGHEAAIVAGLAGRLHVLCEKPFVPPGRGHVVAGFCSEAERQGLVLMANTQWPEVLAVYDQLRDSGFDVDRRPEAAVVLGRRSVAMGLSPAGSGFEMCEDSLSHLLSVAQATAPIDPDTEVEFVDWSNTAAETTATTMRARLRTGEVVIDLRFELAQVPAQPRPAWIEIDGVRIDRHVDPANGYRMTLTGPDGIARPVDDPMGALVYRFAELCRSAGDPRIALERTRIRDRAPLYDSLCAAFRAGP